jgi:Flp pilus assembly protein TadG
MNWLHLRQRCRHERGVAAVEFALVLPLLMMLVFGVVQFGLLFNRQQALHAAAREGARVAALPSSTQTEISGRATSALEGIPMEGTPTVVIIPNITQPCRNRLGETVTVEVSVPTTIEIPMWGTQSRTLIGRGEFRCE